MFERFTWELRATLLGNHARNARNARDARIIHIRTTPDQQRAPASSQTYEEPRPRPKHTQNPDLVPNAQKARPRPTGIGDEAGVSVAERRGLTP